MTDTDIGDPRECPPPEVDISDGVLSAGEQMSRECVLCGASVTDGAAALHERWHEQLNEVLSLLVENSDRESVRQFNRFVLRGGQRTEHIRL